jgi:predicted aspartyl protease
MRMQTVSTWLLAGLFSLMWVLPGVVQADDAQSLLAKHRAFVGWQFGDGSVNSLRLERTYTDASGKVTQRATERRAGLAYRRDFQTVKDYEEGGSTGFTGSIFWTTNQNGFTVPLIGDNAKYYLAIDALFMEGSTELPATLQSSATINGKSVQIVRIAMNGALHFDVYVDPETGAYLRAVIDPGGELETTINILSYADLVAGKKFIGSWSFGTDKGAYNYTKLTLNAPVEAGELHPPAPSAKWTFANGQPFKIEVTDSRIFVNATINGVPGHFILDTGASSIALTDAFADRAHLKTVDKSNAFGIGGTTKTLIRKADTVEIGANTLSNVIVSSLTMQYYSNREQFDGLVGFDLFGGAIVNLSLSDGTMQITDPAAGAASPPSGWYPMTPDLTTFTPRVPARVDDKLDINALLDTGGSTLVLLSNQIEDHGINLVANRAGFLGGNAAIGGVGGYEVTVCGPIAKITVGPFPYTGTEACESRAWGLHQGLVGYDFLKHFDYLFDYTHGVMYMSLRK